ncbi:unnamed protein product [Rotaria sp. Silwood1]|nr:unnamed protein product [Rotaria sp. Silwood1]CAF1689926.1 unnamed protein product [Rotaria sp. Silwood1]CAF3953682.1 unnamed protein product [Rotaria sp. Silwood1]CAF4073270.1 unnamed protein product [Rotaria sp. Silwood1]CAF5027374.1 unnamed protein product [Rotaria sp. Silwood1]
MIQASTIAFVAFVVTTVNAFTTFEIQYQNAALKHHNYLRARHCALPLKLDDELNTIAQDYADYLARTNSFQHSNNGYGENLYMSSSSSPITSVDGTEATQTWYDEIQYYNFNRPGFSSQTGHFTQVVWEGSVELGVGIGFSSDQRRVYVVTNYWPPGNFQGQYAENVSPPNC